MSTSTSHLTTFDLNQVPRTPFARIVDVELRKSRDTRAGWWLLACMGLLAVATYVIMLLMVALGGHDYSFKDYVVAASFGTAVLLPVLGILLVTGEWSQRTAMTTFCLVPERARVIAAKLVAGLLLSTAVAVFLLGTGALATAANAGLGGSATWDGAGKVLVGLVITQGLAMLGGFALAALLLNSPAAIVAFFVYKWIVPVLLSTLAFNIRSFRGVRDWIDFENAQQPLQDLSIHGSEWAHVLVAGLFWLALPLTLGLRRVLRAEVK